MTQEEKELLLKDLSARLMYGVKIQTWYGEIITSDLNTFSIGYDEIDIEQLSGMKPYLRPMSSMTEEEENEYRAINCYEGFYPRNEDALDYVLKHHFDFRGLIPMGLALEVKEEMYNTKKE